MLCVRIRRRQLHLSSIDVGEWCGGDIYLYRQTRNDIRINTDEHTTGERVWVTRRRRWCRQAGSEGVSSNSCSQRKERIAFSSIEITLKCNGCVRQTMDWKNQSVEWLNGGDGESYAYGIEAHCIRCHSNKLPKNLTMHMMHKSGSAAICTQKVAEIAKR